MFAGIVGVHLRSRPFCGRVGEVGATTAAVGFMLLLPGSITPSSQLAALTE